MQVQILDHAKECKVSVLCIPCLLRVGGGQATFRLQGKFPFGGLQLASSGISIVLPPRGILVKTISSLAPTACWRGSFGVSALMVDSNCSGGGLRANDLPARVSFPGAGTGGFAQKTPWRQMRSLGSSSGNTVVVPLAREGLSLVHSFPGQPNCPPPPPTNKVGGPASPGHHPPHVLPVALPQRGGRDVGNDVRGRGTASCPFSGKTHVCMPDMVPHWPLSLD